MTAISEQWANILDPGLRAVFNQTVEPLAASSRIPMLFNQTNSERHQEEDLSVGGFGNFNVYEGAIEYDDVQELFKTTYTHEEFAKGFAVERKLYDDGMYNVIQRKPRELAIAAVRTREVHAASVFNNAFSSSYTGGDGVALCSDSHPYSPTNSATQSNAGSTALSYDSVVATRKLMRAFKDSRGNLMPVNPDTIVVPAELEDTAWTIVNSMNKPGTANNDANFAAAQGLKVVVWDYLTDSNNWFLVDAAMARSYLNWFDRIGLDLSMDPQSDFNLVAKWRAYMRYSYGFSDWRWVYGHEVS